MKQAGQQGLPVSLNLVPLRFFSRESVSVVEYVKLCRNLLYYCIIEKNQIYPPSSPMICPVR